MAYRKSTVPCGIPYITENSTYIHLPNYARRGSHVQIPLAQPPTPPRPRPWLSSGHVDVASPLTFRPKISPGQSHNIIIITD